MFELLSWIVLGLIAGVLAKLIMPGKDPGGYIITILLGLAGSVLGGFIGSLLGISGGSWLTGLLMAVIGALLLLGIYRLIKGSSATTS